MDQSQFDSFLASVPVESLEDGWVEAPAERHMTLYAAHEGVPLTVSKIDAVRVQGPYIQARTRKGETYMIALADVFAVGAEAPKTSGRKAGFGADR